MNGTIKIRKKSGKNQEKKAKSKLETKNCQNKRAEITHPQSLLFN
jgi:hypothetical protein